MDTKEGEIWSTTLMTFIGKETYRFHAENNQFFSDYKGKAPIIGFFMVTTPYYMLLDPDLVKSVLIQKFRHFRNNDFTVSCTLI